MMQETSTSKNLQDLQDIPTPVGEPLSGKYKRSFAYKTIKDRLPIILTKIIDHFSRNKENITNIYGEDSIDEIKYLIGFVSKLKNELVTNKTLKPLRLNVYTSNDEAEEWNKYLKHRTDIEGEIPTWFNTIWLFCECYMYRVLAQEIGLTVKLPRYDPFEDEKQENFTKSIESINALGTFIKYLISNEFNESPSSKSQIKEDFRRLLNISLWGNRCDLSLSAGSDSNYSGHPLEVSESLRENIIINEWEHVWDILIKKKCNIIDIVLDNAGYELFTDLCLAAFLSVYKFANKIRFYVKKYPWYVSDATLHDFYWMLEQMSYLDSYPELQFLSKLYFDFMDDKRWNLEEESYWTSPYNFMEMKEKDPTLYAKLSDAKLVIFKGDLNYRKLVGDINYEYTTSFTSALGDFNPTNLLSLRTVKSDVCVGLAPGAAKSLFKKDKNWMITGQYGLIQANMAYFSNSSSDTCSDISFQSECSFCLQEKMSSDIF